MSNNSHPQPHPNTYWVIPGRLLAGEYPGAAREPLALEKLNAFLECGIDGFLDLTGEGELQPYAHLLKDLRPHYHAPVTHRRLPIPDMGIPEPQHMQAILAQLDTWLATGRQVYVHCWGGIGRTGTVIGCYLVHCGLTGEQALTRMAALWQGMSAEKRRHYPESPQTREQQDFVRYWVAQR